MTRRGWVVAVMAGCLLGSLLGGCAATTSVCPVGTRPAGGASPTGRATWCVATSTPIASLPAPGRTYTSTLGLGVPTQLGGGVKGPFTSWHPGGGREAVGQYADLGARSVPHGTWGFWYADGRRRTLGTYRLGVATGCFAVWDADGIRRTGFVEGEAGDVLRVAPCTPPPDDVLRAAERGGGTTSAPAAWADVAVDGLLGTGGIGARSAGQLEPDPSLAASFALTARLRRGRLRFGPTLAVRTSDSLFARGLAAGGVLGVALPSPHPRFDLEVGLALGVQHVAVTAQLAQRPGTADLGFWAPLGAAQATAALALSPNIAAIASARVEGAPARDVARDVTYCERRGCYPAMRESWEVGGVNVGVALGLRLLFE